MSKRNIVWVLGQTGPEYAAAQHLLATKDIDLLIFNREYLGPLSHQTLQTAVEQFGLPALLITAESNHDEKSMVLDFLKFDQEIWNDSHVKTNDPVELIAIFEKHFDRKDLKTNIELNKTKRIIEINGHKIKLTKREFEIFNRLLLEPVRSVARTEFFSTIWSGLQVCNKVLDVHVSNLRKKVLPYGIIIKFVHPGSFEIVLRETNPNELSETLPEAI
jgi:DNA-binding response OmpR family regulator